MSLVNKVIRDLEDRQALTMKDETRIFRGLSSTGNADSRRGILTANFFVVILFLLASVSATYAIMDHAAEKTIDELDHVAEVELAIGNTPSLEPSNIIALGSKNAKYKGAPGSSGDQALKLDFTLPRAIRVKEKSASKKSDVVKTKTGKRTLHWIGFERSNGILELHLDMTNESTYRAYSLSNPDRVVIEIDDIGLDASLPDISAIQSLRNIRVRREENGKLILVLDAHQPLNVESSRQAMNDRGFGLKISLSPGTKNQDEEFEQLVLLPEMQNREIPEVATSQFGEMSISLNSDRDNNRFERMFQDAEDFYRLDKIIEANELLAIVLREKPDHIDARSLLARKLINQGQLHKAEALLEQELNSRLWNPEWADLYARLLVNKGDITTAIGILEGMKPELSSKPDYYAFLAALYQKNRQHKESISNYKRVLQVRPGNGVWWMGLAISLEALGQKKDALFAYNRALAGKPMSPDLQKYVQGKITYLRKRSRG